MSTLATSAPVQPDVPLSIVHPTDFSSGSRRAFAHALRIALGGRSRLTLVHVGREGEAHWTNYPGIRDTLARWGHVPPKAGRHHVTDLGIKASKVHLDGGDPIKGVLERARKVRADLLVAATHRRGALQRWFKPSMAEAIARGADVPTLLLPPAARGFVDRKTGEVVMRRVLLPITDDPSPDQAIAEVTALLVRLGVQGAVLHLLSVGREPPPVQVPDGPWAIEPIQRAGDVVSTILAESRRVDLVAMTTLGHDSTVDAMLGSTTERVLHSVKVPLLVVPGVR